MAGEDIEYRIILYGQFRLEPKRTSSVIQEQKCPPLCFGKFSIGLDRFQYWCRNVKFPVVLWR